MRPCTNRLEMAFLELSVQRIKSMDTFVTHDNYPGEYCTHVKRGQKGHIWNKNTHLYTTWKQNNYVQSFVNGLTLFTALSFRVSLRKAIPF